MVDGLGARPLRAGRDPSPGRSGLLGAMARLRCLFQPVVELDTGRVVGVESLVRGPAGHWQSPEVLFAAAAEHRLTTQLDWACRRAAADAARAGGLPGGLELFVNVEPVSLDRPVTDEIAAQAAVFAGMSVTVELTERDMAAHLPGMLRTAAWIRAQGWRVAVDDVGADPGSLALLPLVGPEVIKLDLRLVQSGTTAGVAEVVTATNAEAERTGAAVLAEGIETPEHAELAQMMGATLGQGWLYGRPGPLSATALAGHRPAPRRRPPPRGPVPQVGSMPAAGGRGAVFDLVAASPHVRRTGRGLLIAISEQLWGQAWTIGRSAVVVTSFGGGTTSEEYVRRYTALAQRCTYVAVLSSRPQPGLGREVHTGELREPDPACGERSMVVLGPHFAGALLARQLPGGEAGCFEYVVTYDRTTVVAAARELLDRL